MYRVAFISHRTFPTCKIISCFLPLSTLPTLPFLISPFRFHLLTVTVCQYLSRPYCGTTSGVPAFCLYRVLSPLHSLLPLLFLCPSLLPRPFHFYPPFHPHLYPFHTLLVPFCQIYSTPSHCLALSLLPALWSSLRSRSLSLSASLPLPLCLTVR